MSFFGGLLETAGNAVSGGILGGISNGVGGALGLIGANKRMKKQIEMQKNAQKELNEQAAQLNYEYGEKAADSAFSRQMKMYERSYQDQSYEAMRGQMEDAGLSVGLMYGGGGSGGSGGATSGAPMGATGGAVAGNAGDAIRASIEQELGLKQLALQTAGLKIDLENKKKEGDKIDAEANDLNASANLKEAQKSTEDKTREVKYQNLVEEGRFRWMENFKTRWETETSKDELEKGNTHMTAWDHIYGDFEIIDDAIWVGFRKNELDNLVKEGAKIEQNEKLMKVQALLTEEEAKYYYAKMMSEILKNNAETAEAYAKKIATLHNIGEYVNWKTIMDAGINGIEVLTKTIVGGKIGKAAKVIDALKKNKTK